MNNANPTATLDCSGNLLVCKPESESMSFGTLKQIIRSVAQEEDRLNDVIMFGVQEQEQNNLVQCVKEVFDEMKVRPDIREIC